MKTGNTKRKLNLIWRNPKFHASMEHRGPKHWRTTTRSSGGSVETSQIPLEAFLRYRPEVDILPGVTRKCSMRSAFSWFSEFCHSRRLSHFAASFIVTRAEASIAKSCERIIKSSKKKIFKKDECEVITWHQRALLCKTEAHPDALESIWINRHELTVNSGLVLDIHRVNDPSAGSPTETLLRLLLPLSDKVH